ncbi:MAG: glycosyltransferase [Bacteroidetes bacterium]|nr:glycosyltransferase [Bacteroidota bacterium]
MTSKKHLHIISFDVPYPPDYGGVIDVYYKLKALTDIGVEVTLHTYQYGREASKELEKICRKVHYYKRRMYRDPFFSRLPYIVASRNSEELLENLLLDDSPIFFEGVHCCYYLNHPSIQARVKILRMHNIEHVYYKHLAKVEKNFFKKYFFALEAERLKTFEKKLKDANAIAAISPDDTKLLKLRYRNVFYLPVFHQNNKVNTTHKTKNFALYHGNLNVGENNEAALFLVNEVFNDLDFDLVIAGNNPSPELRKAVEDKPNIKLHFKIKTKEINELISTAAINVLPTFQNTGMKLKLINVLFQAGHCLVNEKMVKNTGLEHLCIMANTPQQMKQMIKKFSQEPFSASNAEERKHYLEQNFNNIKNAEFLAEQLFSLQLR